MTISIKKTIHHDAEALRPEITVKETYRLDGARIIRAYLGRDLCHVNPAWDCETCDFCQRVEPQGHLECTAPEQAQVVGISEILRQLPHLEEYEIEDLLRDEKDHAFDLTECDEEE